MSQVSEADILPDDEEEEIVASYVPYYVLVADEKGEIYEVLMDPVSDQTFADLRAVSVPHAIVTQRPDDWDILRSKWIDPSTRELEDRQDIPVDMVQEGGAFFLTNVPTGTEIHVANRREPISSEEVQIASRYSGSYHFRLTCWPYLEKEFTLDVSANAAESDAPLIYIDDLLDPITVDQVVAERARRLSRGFEFDFEDERGTHRIGTAADDMVGWDEVTKVATARHMLGRAESILISTETGPVMVTPIEWFRILEMAGEFRQPIWQASFALQSMKPIPRDFENDSRWPV